MIDVILIDPPQEEPITLAEARLRCRLPDPPRDEAQDQALGAMIRTARAYVEAATGLALCPQGVEDLHDRWSRLFDLQRNPVRRVLAIRYTDPAGEEREVDPGIYVLDTSHRHRAQVFLRPHEVWPAARHDEPGNIRIRYEAGFTPREMPPALREAALALVASLWARGETDVLSVPSEVDNALYPYRKVRA